MYKSPFARPFLVAVLLSGLWTPVQGKIISVMGPRSSEGALPRIIDPPRHLLDDFETNRGQQGFDERQDVVTSQDYKMDGGRVLAAGTLVDSHMLFLNSRGDTRITHPEVIWKFDGQILGVMSDAGGEYEAASSDELGSPRTNYDVAVAVLGRAAPFNARGLESSDSYDVRGNMLLVNLAVTEPGDWMRVITGPKVPEPSAIASLVGLGLVGLIGYRLRSRSAARKAPQG